MEFRRFLRALRKYWWLVVAGTVLGAALGFGYAHSQAATYASRLTFYVSSPGAAGDNANSTNQYLQDHSTSYPGLLSSDKLAQIVQSSGVHASVGHIAGAVSATARLDTVLIDVTVKDTSPTRAVAIARGVATGFPTMVDQLDNVAGQPPTVKVTVVSGPSARAVQIGPRTTLLVAAAAVLGLVLGLALAVLRELLDVVIRVPDQLADLSGAPVLGTVAFDREVKNRPLLAESARYSPRAEAMRQIVTNLRFMDAASAARVVVVTSSVSAEGKSTLSANLAITYAESGSSVVLVEGDLRRPGLAGLFGLEGSLGLSNVLGGQVDLDDVVQPWGDRGLAVLPCGTVPPNPTELLGGARMRALLAELADSYDIVLIDSPPLLPVADSAVLATLADGVVVVFRSGRTRRSHLSSALASLEHVNARVLGCVLNMKAVGRRERVGYAGYYSAAAPATELRPVAAPPQRTAEPVALRPQATAKSGDVRRAVKRRTP